MIQAQRHYSDVTCWATRKRQKHCRLTHLMLHTSLYIQHFSAACFQTADGKTAAVKWSVVKGWSGSWSTEYSTRLKINWSWWCWGTWEPSLHHCHFESVFWPLRSQANEPAKSRITCFSAHTGGLQEKVNLRLDGVWIVAQQYTCECALQCRIVFLHNSICKIRSWRVTLYPACFYSTLNFNINNKIS